MPLSFHSANLAALGGIYARYRSAMVGKDNAGMLEANEGFHFFIYQQSNSAMLLEKIKSIWPKMGPTLNYLFPACIHLGGGSPLPFGSTVLWQR